MNPSTIWATLALPNPAAGGIPFVFTDNATIIINPLQFWWNQTINSLSLGTSGDQTGTDTLNTYKQIDSYLPQSQQAAVAGFGGIPPTIATLSVNSIINGFSCSSSRGTGISPTANTAGDLIGIFGSWSYQSAFTPLAARFDFASGSTSGNLGGEMHFATKADGGILTDRIILDNTGALFPAAVNLAISSASSRLGKANNGFASLNLIYANAGAAGAVTQNVPAGSVQIAAGQLSVILTNSLITANSVVLATLATIDTTATSVRAIPTVGSCTISLNAIATAQVKVNYLVISTDS